MFPIPNLLPSSLPIPTLWVVPVHQPQATSIMHWTWAGDSFHIWYYTCFNAILPNHPTLSLSHRVQKTVLYICLFCCLTYRVIITIFINSIYIYALVYSQNEVKVKSLSRVWLFATPWTAAHQAPPSMGFSRQEYWSWLPFTSPRL